MHACMVSTTITISMHACVPMYALHYHQLGLKPMFMHIS